NFLFTTKDEDATMKLIDFGISDFVRPVLHRSYTLEADIWSIGVITFILLCGSRPFWARTESGIFRVVLRADPNFDDAPWPEVSPEAKDFVKRLLNKDHRKRMTTAQALSNSPVPLDILIYKLVKSLFRAAPLKRAALKDELVYLRIQFKLLEPNKDGRISLDNFKMVLMRNATDAMKESRVAEILNSMGQLSYKKIDFEEFCAVVISTYQLEVLEGLEQIETTAFEFFEQEANRVISIEELAREMNLGPTAHSVLRDWTRKYDGTVS
ncbi:hypothetical protein MKW92_025485, partial [Papaver armeniacum]